MNGNDNFARVRGAFSANPFDSLRALEVEIKKDSPKGDWLQVACPMPNCTDKGGSASISVKSGWLTCHQCGYSGDLFSWIGFRIGVQKPWEVCQRLAERLRVTLDGPVKKAAFKRLPEIDPEVVADLKRRLFDDDDCEGARRFLAERKLWVPDWLERLPLGAWNNRLVFFQHTEKGRLLLRCKVYDPYPPPGRPRWSYSEARSNGVARTTCFWPWLGEIPEGRTLILVEGEWDALTAILRLGLLDRNAWVQTWTGGGGSPIPKDAIPKAFRDRETHILYDNDTFQGIGDDVAPDDKKAAEMRLRKRNLIENVAGSFAANRCTVFLRQVTIPPLAQWGADLRDMVDQGLDDFDKLPAFPLGKCRRELSTATKVEFADVHKHLHELVEFKCQVGGISEDVVVVAKRHSVDCPAGSKKACNNCLVPTIAPNGVLDWGGRQDKLTAAMTSTNMPRHIQERVLEVPAGCKSCTLTPIDAEPGARWFAMARETDQENNPRVIEVVSPEAPPMAGELVVKGYVYMHANGLTPIVMAEGIEALEKLQMPIEPHKQSLLMECPHDTEEVEMIDAFLDRWHADIASNTTHIYGRRDMHVAAGLAMHSALWMHVFESKRRAWLDVCILGATRSGKSAAVRAYLDATFGQHFTPMGNYSRSGFTLGTIQYNGTQKIRPGLFPRNHGRLAAVDEVHIMVQGDRGADGFFPMLQLARDMGRVEASKISGTVTLPAAVRLIAISNWLNGSKTAYQTPAHHLLALYGTPESLARLDFAVPIDELPTGVAPKPVEPFWTSERQRTLVTRAWNMKPEDIAFDLDALELARALCEVTWKARYTEDLPLFTEKEKVYSVLRIAIAIANMTLSHVDGSPMRARVRKVHVQWAAKWLEHTWSLLEYDKVSQIAMATMSSGQLWNLESLLTAELNLQDPFSVQFVLGKLFGSLSRDEMRAITGKDHYSFDPWLMGMIRGGGVETVREGRYTVSFRLTRAAIHIVQKLIRIAEEEPEAWTHRYHLLNDWRAANINKAIDQRPAPSGIAPIDAPIQALLRGGR